MKVISDRFSTKSCSSGKTRKRGLSLTSKANSSQKYQNESRTSELSQLQSVLKSQYVVDPFNQFAISHNHISNQPYFREAILEQKPKVVFKYTNKLQSSVDFHQNRFINPVYKQQITTKRIQNQEPCKKLDEQLPYVSTVSQKLPYYQQQSKVNMNLPKISVVQPNEESRNYLIDSRKVERKIYYEGYEETEVQEMHRSRLQNYTPKKNNMSPPVNKLSQVSVTPRCQSLTKPEDQNSPYMILVSSAQRSNSNENLQSALPLQSVQQIPQFQDYVNERQINVLQEIKSNVLCFQATSQNNIVKGLLPLLNKNNISAQYQEQNDQKNTQNQENNRKIQDSSPKRKKPTMTHKRIIRMKEIQKRLNEIVDICNEKISI